MVGDMVDDRITFSFGENWRNYVNAVTDSEIDSARQNISNWLGNSHVTGKTVVDVGSGSGIHSLGFFQLGAKSVHSFDVDQNSVNATKSLWHKANKPAIWVVEHGSILDVNYIQSLGKFDIVYSWGVLHHTGSIWDAMANVFSLVAPGGKLWIALYQKGRGFERDLALKRKYNKASKTGKRLMEYRRVGKIMLSRLRHLQNPFAWNTRGERGMTRYHDIIDWLGGLPYETASEDEVVRIARKYNFILERIRVSTEGGCSVYIFGLPE